MEPERAWRGPRVAYVVVLLGAVAFVVGCFLPWYEIRLGGRDETVSAWEQLQVGSDEWTLDLSTFLILFGAVAVLAAIAIAGVAGRGHRLWNPALLAVVVMAWFLTSLGTLIRVATLRRSTLPQGPSLKVGFWVQAVSVLVVVLGTLGLLVTARRAAMREPVPNLGA